VAAVKTFEDVKRIKELIQDAEVKAAKAQGVIDSIESKWKEQFGDGSIAAAKNALADLQEKIAKQENKRDCLMKELEELYDWDSLDDGE